MSGLENCRGIVRTLIDDAEVTLAFYGSIVYLSVVSSLGSQATPPPPRVAIGSTAAAASVLYVAHVFAAIVPRAARAGRLKPSELGVALRHDLPLLACALVPIIPLLLAALNALSFDDGYRLSVRLTMALLFGLAVALGRRDGLPWPRAAAAGVIIISIAGIMIWLESLVH
jgi:hypothetical protein